MNPTVLVLNPNCSTAMTQAVAQQLRQGLPPGSVVHEHTCVDGPPIIDSHDSFQAAALAAPAALAQALERHPDTQTVLLACFGDPGLEALRARAGGRRVLGLADCAMAWATQHHSPYAVLTCGPAWMDLLRQRAQELGWGGSLLDVWALPVNGAAWAADPAHWMPALQAAADAAAHQGARSLILGGAVFAGRPHGLHTTLPVIDGVQAVVQALAAPHNPNAS